MKKYYCYFYNREDGIPYYVGKGCNGRIDSKSHPGISLPLKERRIKVADYISGDTSAICKCLNKKRQTRHRGYTFSRV